MTNKKAPVWELFVFVLHLSVFFWLLCVANVFHGTLTASAATRALAVFFCLYKAIGDEDEQCGKGEGDQNPRKIVNE